MGSGLSKATFERTPTYTLAGVRTRCKVLRVYDGDTLYVAIQIHGSVWKYKVRMLGYDSPEMKPLLSAPNRAGEIVAAHAAKHYLEQLLARKTVEAEFHGYCKFGRPLVNLYARRPGWICPPPFELVNKQMVESGHGVPYTGGKKTPRSYGVQE